MKNITDSVCNTRKISNEKIKQKNVLQSKRTGFEGFENLKAWTDETDKYLIYNIYAEGEYVFKTSKSKLDLASKMNSVDHYLSEEFCFFDSKTDRDKFFSLFIIKCLSPTFKKASITRYI